MGIKIRNAKKEDLPEAAKVFHESFNAVGEKWILDVAKTRLEQYFSPEMFWVAEKDSRIIGVLSSKVDNVLYHQELYIDVIAVLPEHQGSGVGKKLIDAAIEYAVNNGLGGIWLSASTELPSFEWYKKLGLEQSSWVTMYKVF